MWQMGNHIPVISIGVERRGVIVADSLCEWLYCVWRALLYGWAAVSSRLDYSIQQSSVKVSTAASTKNLFLLVVILKTFTVLTHTHTHTHLLENDPSLPPLISASLQVLPHLPVLWHVLQALLDTKESRSHFGVGQSVAHDTSQGYKQVCSHWCIGSSHFTKSFCGTTLGSEDTAVGWTDRPCLLRL